MFKMLWISISAIFTLALLQSCKSDPAVVGSEDENIFSKISRSLSYEKPFYSDEAVEKARKYVLEKMPELSQSAVHDVEFTRPLIYQRKLFSRASRDSSKRDIAETCIVWKMPDSDGQNIVVFGVGQARLDDWYPVRVIIKKFDLEEEAKLGEKK